MRKLGLTLLVCGMTVVPWAALSQESAQDAAPTADDFVCALVNGGGYAEFAVAPEATTLDARALQVQIAAVRQVAPTATGTRIPAAAVQAFSHKGACSSPCSHARTMGAQPAACTAIIPTMPLAPRTSTCSPGFKRARQERAVQAV